MILVISESATKRLSKVLVWNYMNYKSLQASCSHQFWDYSVHTSANDWVGYVRVRIDSEESRAECWHSEPIPKYDSFKMSFGLDPENVTAES